MSRRYFEFTDDTSNKFWEIWIDGKSVSTRYGKIGAAGQTTVKEEASPANAQKLYDKLVKEKTGKGYLEKAGTATPSSAPASKPAPAPAAKAAPASAPATPVVVEPGFRRFEFSEGSSNKFWEVKVEGEQQIVRYGKLGTDGQTKEKDFDSPGEAKADTKKLIAEKVGKGYLEVGVPPKPEGNPELEATIEKNLNDPAPYLVYADWLQGKGDPLGELIALQTNKSPSAAALLQKHAATFLGPYAGAEQAQEDGRGITVQWQFGFIKDARLSWDGFDYDTEDDPASDLAAFLELPTTRFLQSLRIGPIPGEDMMTFSSAIEVLVEKAPKNLRRLYLGEIGSWDISGTETGDITPLGPVLQKLESLTLHAGDLGLGKNMSFPELVELNLETGGLGEHVFKNLLTLKAPKLERLNLWFGMENYGCGVGVEDLGPILSGAAFPHLRHLGLMNAEFTDELVGALPKAHVLERLESLDLSMGTLTDKGVDVIVANKAAFAHLKNLNLDNNALSNASEEKVKSLGNAKYGERQDPDRASDDRYRYTAVGE